MTSKAISSQEPYPLSGFLLVGMFILGTESTHKKFSWATMLKSPLLHRGMLRDPGLPVPRCRGKSDQASVVYSYPSWLSGIEMRLPFEACPTWVVSSVFANSACYNIPWTSGLDNTSVSPTFYWKYTLFPRNIFWLQLPFPLLLPVTPLLPSSPNPFAFCFSLENYRLPRDSN